MAQRTAIVVVGFILTMWYVNLCKAGYRTQEKLCFILTMWYVNRYNVIEYKKQDLSFILTMWYVN